MAVAETQPSVSFGCHCFYVGVHFLHLLGLSSSSPYQPSPIPTHCYRDIRYWNHHHRDHQAPWRGTLRHSLRVLHPQNHLPSWSAWDSERSDALFIVRLPRQTVIVVEFSCHLFLFLSINCIASFLFIYSSVHHPRNPHPSEKGAALQCLAPQEAWARQADRPGGDRDLGGWGGAGPLGDQSLLREVRGSSMFCLPLPCSVNCAICQNDI